MGATQPCSPCCVRRGEDPASQHPPRDAPEFEASLGQSAHSLQVEGTPPKRMDRKGIPILPRGEISEGSASHKITFADDEGEAVEEVWEIDNSQLTAKQKLKKTLKGIQAKLSLTRNV
ncbi:unnamed protein product [Symbiodinium natans]|uniref:Uncharacterized protein n=1 Tax=Symbiodinium natans TaxID=878477 RepID=A0A812UM34_9DINO|nr:unnamed protein product [Symbiodinium natans]